MLRKEGPTEWIFTEQKVIKIILLKLYSYYSLKNLKAMDFKFREKQPPAYFVSDLAHGMRVCYREVIEE